MTLWFHAAAEAELVEAVAWYDQQRPGLGDALAADVRATLDRIAEQPEAWHPLTPTTRRCQTQRFPYGVVYQVRGDVILVLAVMHMRRRPGHWRDRRPPPNA